MRGTALSLHRLYARRACGPCSSIAVKVELQVSSRVSTLVPVPGSTFSVLLHADCLRWFSFGVPVGTNNDIDEQFNRPNNF